MIIVECEVWSVFLISSHTPHSTLQTPNSIWGRTGFDGGSEAG